MSRRALPLHVLAASLLALTLGGSLSCLTPAARLQHPPIIDDASNQHTSGLRFIDVGDAFLRVRVTGPASSTKVPLVLVHGFGARLDNWRAVQDALSVDRVVVSFDQKGFGQSERSDGDYGPDKHGRDVLAVMDQLGLPDAVLAGHSYGGGVVMRAALLAPERVRGIALVDALILEEQVPTSFRWARAPVVGEAIFAVLFKELPGEKYVMAFHDGARFTSAHVLDEVHLMQSRDGSTFAQLQTVRQMQYADVEGRYADLCHGLPRVVVWGEKDRVTPLRFGKKVAAAIDADFVVVPAAGHVPLIERPTPVIEAIADVLRQADASGRRSTRTTTTTAPEHRVQP